MKTSSQRESSTQVNHTNIYLDIDGVLITKDMKPAAYADEFIEYVLNHYTGNVYWLTTRCQGDAGKTVNGMASLFNDETVALLRQIKPTSWLDSPLKTSAIDFDNSFLWFDDYILDADKRMLAAHDLLDNWIKVNLNKYPNQLSDFLRDFPLPIQ